MSAISNYPSGLDPKVFLAFSGLEAWSGFSTTPGIAKAIITSSVTSDGFIKPAITTTAVNGSAYDSGSNNILVILACVPINDAQQVKVIKTVSSKNAGIPVMNSKERF